MRLLSDLLDRFIPNTVGVLAELAWEEERENLLRALEVSQGRLDRELARAVEAENAVACLKAELRRQAAMHDRSARQCREAIDGE